jgi:hypothetical protein
MAGGTTSARKLRAFLAFLAASLMIAAVCSASAQERQVSLAIADFSYRDTSGEVRDQTADHRAWLAMFSRLLREEVAGTGKFRIVTLDCPASECAVAEGVAPQALVAAAGQAGATYLVFGGIQKMSTLVQWARLVALDPATGKVVLDRLYTFRGDNEEAWRHAALFVARHVNALQAQN